MDYKYVRIKGTNGNYRYQWRNHYIHGYQEYVCFTDIEWWVSSHIRYLDAARRCVASLNKIGIVPRVAVTGCSTSCAGASIGVRDSVTYSDAIDAWEYGGLYVASTQASRGDGWIMFVHDTCIVDTDHMIKQQFNGPFDFISNWKHQFNIGLFRVSWLRTQTEWLRSLNGISKADGIALEVGPHGLRGRGRYNVMFGEESKELGYEMLPGGSVKRRHVCRNGIHKYYVSGDATGGRL